MSAFADLVRFIPTAGGTTDWTFSTAVGGCQSPTAAGAVNGASYKVYAVSADLTQWEVSQGIYSSGILTFPRTTVLYNSSGTGTATGQSGAGTKLSFSTVPQVSVVALAEDLVPQQVGQLPGTAANDNAGAGNVGEFISATGTSVALPNSTLEPLASISLTAGDWDISGVGQFGVGSVTSTNVFFRTGISLSNSANTLIVPGSTFDVSAVNPATGFGVTTVNIPTPVVRVSLAATTTVFLTGISVFSAGTMTAFGFIRARRVR